MGGGRTGLSDVDDATASALADANKKKNEEIEKFNRMKNITDTRTRLGSAGWKYMDDPHSKDSKGVAKLVAGPDLFLEPGLYRLDKTPPDDFDIRVEKNKDGSLNIYPVPFTLTREYKYKDPEQLRRGYERVFDFVKEARGGTTVKLTMDLGQNFDWKYSKDYVRDEVMMILHIAERKQMGVDLSGFQNVLDMMPREDYDEIMKFAEKVNEQPNRKKLLNEVSGTKGMQLETAELKGKEKLDDLPGVSAIAPGPAQDAAIETELKNKVFEGIPAADHQKKLEAIEKEMKANEERLAGIERGKGILNSSLEAQKKLVSEPDKYRRASLYKADELGQERRQSIKWKVLNFLTFGGVNEDLRDTKRRTWGVDETPQKQETTKEFVEHVIDKGSKTDVERNALQREMKDEVTDIGRRQDFLKKMADDVKADILRAGPMSADNDKAYKAIEDKHNDVKAKATAELGAGTDPNKPTVFDLQKRNDKNVPGSVPDITAQALADAAKKESAEKGQTMQRVKPT